MISKFTKGEDSQFMANRRAASTHVCSRLSKERKY